MYDLHLRRGSVPASPAQTGETFYTGNSTRMPLQNE
jgi:hypothetical protein